jgi:hypothetical protein
MKQKETKNKNKFTPIVGAWPFYHTTCTTCGLLISRSSIVKLKIRMLGHKCYSGIFSLRGKNGKTNK